jgi:hypothetical protein
VLVENSQVQLVRPPVTVRVDAGRTRERALTFTRRNRLVIHDRLLLKPSVGKDTRQRAADAKLRNSADTTEQTAPTMTARPERECGPAESKPPALRHYRANNSADHAKPALAQRRSELGLTSDNSAGVADDIFRTSSSACGQEIPRLRAADDEALLVITAL